MDRMKNRKLTLICAALVGLAGTIPSYAEEKDPFVMAVDAVVVRPICFASTVVGSALFVVALPVAAIAKSVKPAANALVVGPAKATFTRPLGDMNALMEANGD
jgi:hypothetical protein